MNKFFITILLTFFVLSFSSAVFANVTEDLVGKNVRVFFNDGNSCVFFYLINLDLISLR